MKDWEGSSAYVEQGRHWSSALIWLCTVLFGGTLLWAFTARIDQTVTVRGRLSLLALCARLNLQALVL